MGLLGGVFLTRWRMEGSRNSLTRRFYRQVRICPTWQVKCSCAGRLAGNVPKAMFHVEAPNIARLALGLEVSNEALPG